MSAESSDKRGFKTAVLDLVTNRWTDFVPDVQAGARAGAGFREQIRFWQEKGHLTIADLHHLARIGIISEDDRDTVLAGPEPVPEPTLYDRIEALKPGTIFQVIGNRPVMRKIGQLLQRLDGTSQMFDIPLRYKQDAFKDVEPTILWAPEGGE